MDLPKREIKKITHSDNARASLLAGAEKIYETVSSTFGPAGNNVILGMPFGDPTITRDGVTVAKRVVLEDRTEDNAAAILRQASEKTNRSAGDGTTATIVLAYHLYKRGHRLIAAGDNGMLIKKQLVDDSQKIIKYLKKESQNGKNKLLEVATVSAGDAAIGALISDTIKEVGDEGGITIREQNYPTLDVEKVNGYYFDKGFFALNQQVEYARPLIFVTNKQIASNADIIPLLSGVINSDNKNLIIVGDVRMNSEALNTLLLNVLQGKLNAVVIPPPAYGDDAVHFIDDIATYVGSIPFTAAQDMKEVLDNGQLNPKYFGSAERVQANQDRAVIFKGAGLTEDIVERASAIQKAMKTETSSHRKDTMEQRYSKLTGKIAIVNVGGSTPVEMEELRYRVEDAIEATKSAMTDGVLPGGATMLVHAAELPISKMFKDALQDTFKKLMENAAESPDYRLEQVKHSPIGYGFNLRDITDEPIDLTAAGVYDATRAVTQTIENAVSAAGYLLTVGAIVDPIDQDGPTWDKANGDP